MQVTIRQFVKDLQEGLKQAILGESIKLGKGQCATLDEYKKYTGIIIGYERAAHLSQQMLMQMEESDHADDSELPEMDTGED
jgi:hypothetical protein